MHFRKHLLIFSLFFLPLIIFAQTGDTIQPTANLVVQGIPAIPASVAQSVKKYTEARSASITCWHPVKKEMLITTRFGATNQIHLLKMAGGARTQITFYDEPVTTAIYEPTQGNYFLFLKDVGGNEFSQIYRYDVKDGNVTLLTDGGRTQNGGLNWSNSGKWIAYGSTKRNGADRDIYIMDPLHPETNKLLLQVQGGGWGVYDWSKDDKQLLVSEDISVNESHLWLVDVATGNKTALTPQGEKNVAYGVAFFSKDGKGIYFTTDKDNEFQRLAYMNLNTKKIDYLTSSINWDVDNAAITKDGKQIAFTVNEAGISKLYLFSVAAHNFKEVKNIPVGVITGFAWHNNNRDLALGINNAQLSNDIYVLDATTQQLTRWTESELGGMVASELSMPELIKWKSFDNREISGFYFKPNKKFTGKRPVIISIHGGPEGQSQPVFLGRANYYLNELGVAIIMPNVRGSTGYGKTFVALDNGMKREESVQDIGTLLDWIAQQPGLDASRIMITGGSYGGYMTLACATHYNDRIRCALDVVGISNFNTFLKNTESYRRDLRRVEYGDERDTVMAAFFEKISPQNNASKIKKPLFIVAGGNDPRVPITESVQMAETVKKNRTNVWFLEAKDEGHGFRKKNNIDFQFYATILFVQHYLLGE